MITKLSNELLKFYNNINSKNITDSKLSYTTIVNRLRLDNEFIEMEDLENLLQKEIHLDNDIIIEKNIIEYICDFFKFISKKNLIESEECAKCIYAILDKENVQIDVNEFISYLQKEIYQLELSENLKDNIDKAYYYGISIVDIKKEDLPIFENIVKEIDNIQLFIFDDKKLVIINKNDKKEKINSYELYNKSRDDYYNKNYEECINKLSMIMKNDKIKVNICGKLGLCYMMLKKYNVAIDYLTFATYLNENNNPKYDYSDLIFDLQNNIMSSDKKTRFKMLEDEFYDDMNNYFNITQINDIILSVNNGTTIEEACKLMGLTEEQINLVYLIYARECYFYSDYYNGDKYIKYVQKKENRTDYVNSVLNMLIVNKYYYKNRKRNENNIKILKLSNI